MKAPRFAYARPASVAEALALLAQHKDEARVLAGGQSLVPMLNFRVAAPKVLVDINRIAGLSGNQGCEEPHPHRRAHAPRRA